MLIRKEFKFENAHIVRGCSTVRCRSSIHGHSYRAEVLMESNFLDNGQMVYDFGLIKHSIKDLIDSFDHSIALWDGDEREYVKDMKKHSARWVQLPVSPSAEQLSRVLFIIVDTVLKASQKINGEKEVKLHSIIVHETATGYAQAFREDAYNDDMGVLPLNRILFSEAIKADWHDKNLWDKLMDGETFTNPSDV